jgi:integrase
MSVYRQKGRKTFVMDFVFKGHRVFKTTGQTNKKRAEKFAEAYQNELKDGARGLRKSEPLYFLGEAAKAWRNKPREKPWSASTAAIADSDLKRLLPAFGEDRLLADIEAEDIAQYQRNRLAEKKPPSNRTVNMEVGTLRKILIHAGHWARIRDNRDHGVCMLAEREDVGQALTATQEVALLRACGRSASRALLPFVTLAIDTGARYNTIRLLQWGRVNLERGFITIGKDKTKAGTGRTVPLNTRALQTLLGWAKEFPDRKPEHFVFPTQSYGLHGKKGQAGKGGEVRAYAVDPTHAVGTIKKAWTAAKRRTQLACPACAAGQLTERKPGKRKRGVAVEPPAEGWECKGCGHTTKELPEGLSTFRFHDLRHTAVSRWIVAGKPLHMIAKVVGWTPSTVVDLAKRYGHFDDDAMRSVVEVSPLPPVPYESPYASTAKGDVVQ